MIPIRFLLAILGSLSISQIHVAAQQANESNFAIRFQGEHGINITGTNQIASLHSVFTAEMIVRWKFTKDAMRLFGTRVDQQNLPNFNREMRRFSGWQIIVQHEKDNGQRLWPIYGGSGGSTRTSNLDGSLWHHLAFSRRSDGWFQVWLDGKSIARSKHRVIEDDQTSNLTIGIAAENATQRMPFYGDVLAFRLSSSDRYSDDFEPPKTLEKDQNTLALFDFERPQAGRVMDLSGHGHHGILFGATWIDSETGNPLHARQLKRLTSSQIKRLYGAGVAASSNTVSKSPPPTKGEKQLPGFNQPIVSNAESQTKMDSVPNPPAKAASPKSDPASVASKTGQPPLTGSVDPSKKRLDQMDENSPQPLDGSPQSLERSKVDEAIVMVKDIFSIELKEAESPTEKKKLSRLLQDKALTFKEQETEIALLEIAVALSAEAGEFDDVQSILNRIEKHSLETKDIRFQVFSTLSDLMLKTYQREALVREFLRLAEDCVGLDDLELAKKASLLAQSHLPRRADRELRGLVDSVVNHVAFSVKQARLAEMAAERLETDPDNGIAHLELGKHLCFTKGNWALGLTHLSVCSSKTLSDVSKLDLENQKAPSKWILTADAWWDVAQNVQGPERRGILVRAEYWYSKCLLDASGLEKMKAEKRLEQIATQER